MYYFQKRQHLISPCKFTCESCRCHTVRLRKQLPSRNNLICCLLELRSQERYGMIKIELQTCFCSLSRFAFDIRTYRTSQRKRNRHDFSYYLSIYSSFIYLFYKNLKKCLKGFQSSLKCIHHSNI